MAFKFNIRREVKILAVLIVLLGLIAFTERLKGELTVSAIRISLQNVHENHYVDEADVMKLMRLNAAQLTGASLKTLNFSALEARIRESPYISNAELFSDLKGNLTVTVSLRRPIARIVQNLGPDAYIGEDGAIMPVSEKFTSRVALVTGALAPKLLAEDNLYDIEEGRQLMLLLRAVAEDPFWKAQIAQIDLDQKNRAVLFTQVGDERIEFGEPIDLDTKFRKLRIFYKEILPQVGWNKYDRINVEYEGQVVAE